MIEYELQFFGGRGSGGGKGGGGKSGGGTKLEMDTATKSFPAGIYVDEDGEEYEISYRKRGNSYEQVIDGKPYGGVIRDYSKKSGDTWQYEAEEPGGRHIHTNSLVDAGKFAFGSPKDEGWRKKR